ncbi:MAG TPA: winged helix-turn-helix domain-containing protein [Steroidobacteraceae bacterium]
MTVSDERAQVFGFGDFVLDASAHELRRQGARIRLQDQPFQILRLLLEQAGKVVTRDELRQRIWPSSVFVDFDHGLNNAIARLREVLRDEASAPRFIETVPRVGYRFIGAVTAGSETPVAAVPDASGMSTPETRIRRRRLAVAGAAIGVLAIAGLYAGIASRRPSDVRPAPAEAPVPSIAVLPFVNLGPDPDDEYFADGLTEELVTRLATLRGLRVVARTSSFSYKGKQESTATIAKALQVDHILEGSVRRSEQRLRITAQLIDARGDRHVWSQTFDRDGGDIFRIQEEISLAVAEALKVTLLDSDEYRIRRHGTDDAEAYRLYVIAHAHLLGRTKGSDQNVAKRLLEAAIARDPNFAAAHADLARSYLRRVSSTLANAEENERLGMAAAERAMALDPELSQSLQARANFQFWRYRVHGDYEAHIAGETNLQRAIELDPANSLAYEDFGRAILWHEPDLAMSLLERAIEVDVLCTFPNVLIATLHGNRGELDAARKRCGDLVARNPDARICSMAVGTLETYFGNFDRAIPLLRSIENGVGGPARIQLWSMYMSMGDPAGADEWLDFGKEPFEKSLSDAARHAAHGRHDRAYAVLEQFRREHPDSRLLDLPAARFALLAGKPREALAIIERRFPDLVKGIEPISARNVLPAIDLAMARLHAGARPEGEALLGQVAAHLDGSDALRLPMFTFQRARIHALAGEADAAFAALDRAYEQGLRTVWALDLRPQSYLYVDPLEADPALAGLRADPRFARWLGRIRDANSAQRQRLTDAQNARAV